MKSLNFSFISSMAELSLKPNTSSEETVSINEDEQSKDEEKYTFSQLRGIEFNYTGLGESKLAIRAWSFIGGLKYLRIQLIENESLKEVFISAISTLYNIEEIILEWNSSFLWTYPKNNITFNNEELPINKIELRMWVCWLGFRETFYSIETNYLSISFNYTVVEVFDLDENTIEIDGSDYCSYIHIRGINILKSKLALCFHFIFLI